ncbi:MAG: hypothetical protein AAFZ92_01450 [Pseudomonadota bacterium]
MYGLTPLNDQIQLVKKSLKELIRCYVTTQLLLDLPYPGIAYCPCATRAGNLELLRSASYNRPNGSVSSDNTLNHSTLNHSASNQNAPNNISDKPALTAKTSSEAVPSDFPAPAKKLHTLINDTNKQAENSQTLEAKVKQLDKQLAELNKQLEAQGIALPQQQPPPSAASPSGDTKTRLNAIKDHMSQKQSSLH